ncbi:hypothetical protein [Methanosarcina sp.]|nr:hypothetical protein [Methanosarcina sp.]MDW5549909.1 hypothetical protein [Methanosarcina sp.]MDW5552513.1 hypothetical protein [Methanosarcina sp.]MDW5560243.1 hypothetical protein [Methanosarcina sp.]
MAFELRIGAQFVVKLQNSHENTGIIKKNLKEGKKTKNKLYGRKNYKE